MSRKRAFTLIELLVVIAIIALLLSILMPSLGLAKKVAEATTCGSNLRNVGLVGNMYRHDHNGRLLTSVDSGSSSDIKYYPVLWLELGYWDDLNAALCPSHDPRRWDGDHDNFDETHRYGYGIRYFPPPSGSPELGDPFYDLSASKDGKRMMTLKLENARNTADLGLATDTYHGTTGLQHARWHHWVQTNNATAHLRHAEQVNLLFLDGHVERAGPHRIGQSIEQEAPKLQYANYGGRGRYEDGSPTTWFYNMK